MLTKFFFSHFISVDKNTHKKRLISSLLGQTRTKNQFLFSIFPVSEHVYLMKSKHVNLSFFCHSFCLEQNLPIEIVGYVRT